MAETSQLPLEVAFTGKNMGPRFFNPHRLFWILFPLKAQARIRVCPLGDPGLESRRDIIKDTLITVEKLLILPLHLRAQHPDRLVEIRLRANSTGKQFSQRRVPGLHLFRSRILNGWDINPLHMPCEAVRPSRETVKLVLAGDKFALIRPIGFEISQSRHHGLFGAWLWQVLVRFAKCAINVL